jgi:hypothetical protein
VPDTALVRLLQPLQLHIEKIKSLDILDNSGLPSRMRRLEIAGRQGAAQPMVRSP